MNRIVLSVRQFETRPQAHCLVGWYYVPPSLPLTTSISFLVVQPFMPA